MVVRVLVKELYECYKNSKVDGCERIELDSSERFYVFRSPNLSFFSKRTDTWKHMSLYIFITLYLLEWLQYSDILGNVHWQVDFSRVFRIAPVFER